MNTLGAHSEAILDIYSSARADGRSGQAGGTAGRAAGEHDESIRLGQIDAGFLGSILRTRRSRAGDCAP